MNGKTWLQLRNKARAIRTYFTPLATDPMAEMRLADLDQIIEALDRAAFDKREQIGIGGVPNNEGINLKHG